MSPAGRMQASADALAQFGLGPSDARADTVLPLWLHYLALQVLPISIPGQATAVDQLPPQYTQIAASAPRSHVQAGQAQTTVHRHTMQVVDPLASSNPAPVGNPAQLDGQQMYTDLQGVGTAGGEDALGSSLEASIRLAAMARRDPNFFQGAREIIGQPTTTGQTAKKHKKGGSSRSTAQDRDNPFKGYFEEGDRREKARALRFRDLLLATLRNMGAGYRELALDTAIKRVNE
jgi:hypothetical protein